jgi:hypothetical protein
MNLPELLARLWQIHEDETIEGNDWQQQELRAVQIAFGETEPIELAELREMLDWANNYLFYADVISSAKLGKGGYEDVAAVQS